VNSGKQHISAEYIATFKDVAS